MAGPNRAPAQRMSDKASCCHPPHPCRGTFQPGHGEHAGSHGGNPPHRRDQHEATEPDTGQPGKGAHRVIGEEREEEDEPDEQTTPGRHQALISLDSLRTGQSDRKRPPPSARHQEHHRRSQRHPGQAQGEGGPWAEGEGADRREERPRYRDHHDLRRLGEEIPDRAPGTEAFDPRPECFGAGQGLGEAGPPTTDVVADHQHRPDRGDGYGQPDNQPTAATPGGAIGHDFDEGGVDQIHPTSIARSGDSHHRGIPPESPDELGVEPGQPIG